MRAGRKRNNKPTKAIPPKVVEPGIDRTAYWKGVDVRERTIDNKLVNLVSRETAIEVTLRGLPSERAKRLTRTAEEFARLWELCRRYYLDAPPISPKVSSPSIAGHSHEGELTDGVISFGRQCHLRYQDAINALAGIPPTPEGRALIMALLAICVENKMPTELGKNRGIEALDTLTNHWRL